MQKTLTRDVGGRIAKRKTSIYCSPLKKAPYTCTVLEVAFCVTQNVSNKRCGQAKSDGEGQTDINEEIFAILGFVFGP